VVSPLHVRRNGRVYPLLSGGCLPAGGADGRRNVKRAVSATCPSCRGFRIWICSSCYCDRSRAFWVRSSGLEGVSQAVIDELKGIVEHQFIDPKLDLDAMAEFSFAVRSLRGMAFSEDVTLLHRATDDLKRIGLEDQASLLIRASADLKHLNDLDAFALRQVRNDLDDSFSRFSAGLREVPRDDPQPVAGRHLR
jgi:hypothetical protein